MNPLYAIIDIETTGGHPSKNRITEISIKIHNGEKVVETFETLINPEIPIPVYLQAFTGITDKMVENAPLFEQVATKIFELLHGKIFIAHNVNFDYSFIKHQLEECGINFTAKRLCTVRLSRKIFPGKKSYSLGNICAALGIDISFRHRAGGDADATVKLFEILLKSDENNVVAEMLSHGNKEQLLPPNVSRDDFDKLPKTPGVYYFIDNRGLALYVGKAKNIKSRVSSHFSGKLTTKQKQNFLRDIYGLSYLQTGTELLASLIESHEIKRLWPEENRSQKKITQHFGLYDYVDQNGKVRLGIDKLRKDVKPLLTFNNYTAALSYLNQVVTEYGLCPKLCNLQNNQDDCHHLTISFCEGACLLATETDSYNNKVNVFITNLNQDKKTYFITDAGRHAKEISVVIYEPDHFIGYCFVNKKEKLDFDILIEMATPLKLNLVMENLLARLIDGTNLPKSTKIYTQLKIAML